MELAILPDGSVFLLGDDQRWHHIPDVATANALGIDWNTLPSYDELPGEVGDPLPSVISPASAAQPAAQQPTPAAGPVAPTYAGPLAGLLGDRSVYLAGDRATRVRSRCLRGVNANIGGDSRAR